MSDTAKTINRNAQRLAEAHEAVLASRRKPLVCRECGGELRVDEAVWLGADNRPADKPAHRECYEREIRNAGRDRMWEGVILGPSSQFRGPNGRRSRRGITKQRRPGAAEQEYQGRMSE